MSTAPSEARRVGRPIRPPFKKRGQAISIGGSTRRDATSNIEVGKSKRIKTASPTVVITNRSATGVREGRQGNGKDEQNVATTSGNGSGQSSDYEEDDDDDVEDMPPLPIPGNSTEKDPSMALAGKKKQPNSTSLTKNTSSSSTTTLSTTTIKRRTIPGTNIVLPPKVPGVLTMKDFCTSFQLETKEEKAHKRTMRRLQREASRQSARSRVSASDLPSKESGNNDENAAVVSDSSNNPPSNSSNNGGNGVERNNPSGDNDNQGPMVEIVNGEIVVRESSLVVGAPHNSRRTIEEVDAELNNEVVEEEGDPTILTATYRSFTTRDPAKHWDVDATVLFYKALQVYGLDFVSMSQDPDYFGPDDNAVEDVDNPRDPPPGRGIVRTKSQLTNKYKRECRFNPHLMDLVFRGEVQLAASTFLSSSSTTGNKKTKTKTTNRRRSSNSGVDKEEKKASGEDRNQSTPALVHSEDANEKSSASENGDNTVTVSEEGAPAIVSEKPSETNVTSRIATAGTNDKVQTTDVKGNTQEDIDQRGDDSNMDQNSTSPVSSDKRLVDDLDTLLPPPPPEVTQEDEEVLDELLLSQTEEDTLQLNERRGEGTHVATKQRSSSGQKDSEPPSTAAPMLSLTGQQKRQQQRKAARPRVRPRPRPINRGNKR